MIENEAIKISDLDAETDLIRDAAELYKCFNPAQFAGCTVSCIFRQLAEAICFVHGQSPNITYTQNNRTFEYAKNNKILVAYSGGLDSAFQALYLKAKGYDVTLYHLSGANWYTNGQEAKVVKEFAEKFNFKLYIPKISPKFKNEFAKHWYENSFKNFLIYTIGVEYMLAHDISYLSSGDDMRLSLSHSVLGTNTGDTSELTTIFMNTFNVNYLPVDAKINKAQRLKFLADNGARDIFISCVSAGRLIQSMRSSNIKKYDVTLDAHNCGCGCRKDAMHNLLDFYYNNISFPQNFVEACWDRVAIGADNMYFDKSIPLEKRIKNLIDY